MLAPRGLKLVGAAGSLLAVGASAVAVAADTKPAAAPLKPAVDAGRPATSSTTPSAADALVIPPTGACQGSGGAGARPGASPAGAAPAHLDPSLAGVADQLRQAKTTRDRSAILGRLSPDQRMQVTAFLQPRRPAQRAGAGAPSCRGQASTDPSVAPPAPIDATVVAGGQVAPVSVSAVS